MALLQERVYARYNYVRIFKDEWRTHGPSVKYVCVCTDCLLYDTSYNTKVRSL